VDPLLVEQLCLYDWPLNVRELTTAVRRLLVLCGHEGHLKLDHLPARLRQRARATDEAKLVLEPAQDRSPGPSEVDRDDFDYARLVNALRRHDGNMSRAAADAGISRQRAYRLIQARPDHDPSTEDGQEKT
jgi:transcriptional regulator of acetoin/glycerol metabolism